MREVLDQVVAGHKHQGTHPAAAVAREPSFSKTSKMAKQGGKGKALERGGLER